MGWDFIKNPRDFNNESKRFGIWSGRALKEMGIRDGEQDAYTAGIQKVMNHKNNTNGKLCKVLFTTVVEGISLERISQIHITSPWWNESKMEQTIGRGIRYCSHSDLPLNKQYVDVYYHCSVFDSFKNYPSVNKDINLQIINALSNNEETKNNLIKKKYRHPQDYDRITIEQRVFIVAERKKNVTVQFEKAIKEAAIDCELNKYGNLAMFEEILSTVDIQEDIETIGKKTYNSIKYDITSIDNRILYYRDENKYFYYTISKNELRHLTIMANPDGKPIWPFLKAVLGDVVSNKTWEQTSVKIKDIKDGRIVSYMVVENIVSFNGNTTINKMNFVELMKYSVEELGENIEVWKYFEDQRIRNSLFDILVSVYDMTSYDINNSLIVGFQNSIISEDIPYKKELNYNVATNSLIKKFAEITRKKGDSVLANEILDIIPGLPVRIPLNKQIVKKNIDELSRTFMKDINESYIEKLKQELVSSSYTIEELNGFSSFKILELYNTYKDKEKNFTNKKKKAQFTTNI